MEITVPTRRLKLEQRQVPYAGDDATCYDAPFKTVSTCPRARSRSRQCKVMISRYRRSPRHLRGRLRYPRAPTLVHAAVTKITRSRIAVWRVIVEPRIKRRYIASVPDRVGIYRRATAVTETRLAVVRWRHCETRTRMIEPSVSRSTCYRTKYGVFVGVETLAKPRDRTGKSVAMVKR